MVAIFFATGFEQAKKAGRFAGGQKAAPPFFRDHFFFPSANHHHFFFCLVFSPSPKQKKMEHPYEYRFGSRPSDTYVQEISVTEVDRTAVSVSFYIKTREIFHFTLIKLFLVSVLSGFWAESWGSHESMEWLRNLGLYLIFFYAALLAHQIFVEMVIMKSFLASDAPESFIAALVISTIVVGLGGIFMAKNYLLHGQHLWLPWRAAGLFIFSSLFMIAFVKSGAWAELRKLLKFSR